jgi:hypothetical protein
MRCVLEQVSELFHDASADIATDLSGGAGGAARLAVDRAAVVAPWPDGWSLDVPPMEFGDYLARWPVRVGVLASSSDASLQLEVGHRLSAAVSHQAALPPTTRDFTAAFALPRGRRPDA